MKPTSSRVLSISTELIVGGKYDFGGWRENLRVLVDEDVDVGCRVGGGW